MTAIKPKDSLKWMEKLALLLGRPPIMEGVDENAKWMKLDSREESAKDLFMGCIKQPKDKAKAKKLGLL